MVDNGQNHTYVQRVIIVVESMKIGFRKTNLLPTNWMSWSAFLVISILVVCCCYFCCVLRLPIIRLRQIQSRQEKVVEKARMKENKMDLKQTAVHKSPICLEIWYLSLPFNKILLSFLNKFTSIRLCASLILTYLAYPLSQHPYSLLLWTLLTEIP